MAAAIAEQREPHLSYSALDMQEVQTRIAKMQHLNREIDQQEPNAIVRRLYHGAIEDEICFLRLIEATSQGDNERFWELSRYLYPVPSPDGMQDALTGVRNFLLQEMARPSHPT